jgi:pilus assembly protein CpaE
MHWINALFRSGSRLTRLAKCEHGAAAAEFSMFLPLFVFGGLAMSDVGLALHQRMTLDHVVRAGVQAAMADPGQDEVLATLETTASKNFPPADADGQTLLDMLSGSDSVTLPVTLNVSRYCSCPEDRSLSVSCTNLCSETVPPFVFYRVSAAKTFDGVFLPEFSLGREMEVEIR